MFATKKGDALEQSPIGQSSNYPETPPTQTGLSANSVRQVPLRVKPICTQALQDMSGKELNLDGTQKLPYMHPHFVQVTTTIHEGNNRGPPMAQ